MTVSPGLHSPDALTGQCAGDENNFAVLPSDSASVMGQIIDNEIIFALWFLTASCHNKIPSENSIFADLSRAWMIKPHQKQTK
jgi:hypothetical protein